MYRSHGDPLLGLPTLTLAPALSSSPTGLFCQFAACQTLQELWAAGLTMSERWTTPRCPSETGFLAHSTGSGSMDTIRCIPISPGDAACVCHAHPSTYLCPGPRLCSGPFLFLDLHVGNAQRALLPHLQPGWLENWGHKTGFAIAHLKCLHLTAAGEK